MTICTANTNGKESDHDELDITSHMQFKSTPASVCNNACRTSARVCASLSVAIATSTMYSLGEKPSVLSAPVGLQLNMQCGAHWLHKTQQRQVES